MTDTSQSDSQLLATALESLERVGCDFWACEGPTLDPIDMITCHRCLTVAELRQRLGRPIVHLEETREYARAVQLKREAGYGHRVLSIDRALSMVRARALVEEFGSDPARAAA